MISAVFAATVLFFQAAPAANSGPAAPGAPAKSVSPVTVTAGSHTTVEAGGEVICHDEVRLGSLFPKRVCAHKDEMADRRQTDQQLTRRLQTPYEIFPPDTKR